MPFPELDAAFAGGGALAAAVPDFRARPQQLEMARAIAAAIAELRPLVAEAGTGTGKTFAYLVPALLYGGKVIVSTGTKTLQDQLFQRDLPLVRDALKVPGTVALLKGRANYVCHHHLEHALHDGRFASRADVADLHRIAEFARVSASGDKGELAGVSESSPVWTHVTSTRDDCLGSECPRHRECFVMNARKEALQADVVVVNHHLFFADVVLRDEGLAELLPACNTVVLDEAHQLPDTATLFFGEQVTAGQLADLARDAEAAGLADARESRDIPEAAGSLGADVKRVRAALGRETGKRPRAAACAHPGFADELARLGADLADLDAALAVHAARSEDLERCAERARELGARLAKWLASDDPAWVRWLDVTPNGWQLHASPLSVAEIFSRQIGDTARAWIFTSATLAVGGDFGHFQQALGLEGATTACWDSPFDYARQALLYVPKDLPAPNRPEHTDAVVDLAVPVLRASGGRAFLLFTTLRALERARARLAARLAEAGLPFPVLAQGEQPRNELLTRFRELGNAVLLGSQSFWEGVDVRGEALSVVVIDKLPFAPPDDPVVAARLDHLARQGRNAFFDYQLPEAAINLKQGAGRLIRSEADRGVLVICDERLVDRPYGRRIWRSLPPMRRTRDMAEVLAFFTASASPASAVG
jgi:ATP-dependent DNA helicase DinG